MRPIFAFLCVLALSFATSAVRAESLETLKIDSANGGHVFKVEVMRTRAEMEKGLMFRHYLPDDRGMLFDFKTPQPILMWMKNTYLPLDMVFIDQQGRVINIAADAEPLSETTIPSQSPAVGVLEVNAGTAKKLGIAPGDRVEASIFPKAE